MAIFRSLKSLISQSVKNSRSSALTNSRTFFSAPIPIPSPFPNLGPNTSRHILFRSGLLFFPPLNGPLFLSNPPWKLSQSSTPLLLQSDVVLKFLKLRGLDLRSGVPKLVDASAGEDRKWDGGDVAVEGFRISDDYLNVPNLISFARLLSGPLLGWMIINDMYSTAFIGLAISGVSDWLDGYVARKMRINSVIGSYLDPLADKVLIGFVALAMVDKGLLHPGLVALVVLRDVSLVGGAVYKRAISLDWKRNNWRDFFDLNGANVERVEPLFISKVNTVFQLALVAGALLQPEFGNAETQLYLNYLSWLVASTTIASTAAYGVQHLRHRAASMNKSPRT